MMVAVFHLFMVVWISIAYYYDSQANTDDGSCCYVAGCTDPAMFNYNAAACYEDGSCVPFIYGCTDSGAYNYDSSANTDDGSCQYCDLSISLMVMARVFAICL